MNDRPDRIIRIRAVLDRTGLSRATLYRKLDNGTFPFRRQISQRCVGWLESEVEAWIERSGSGNSGAS